MLKLSCLLFCMQQVSYCGHLIIPLQLFCNLCVNFLREHLQRLRRVHTFSIHSDFCFRPTTLYTKLQLPEKSNQLLQRQAFLSARVRSLGMLVTHWLTPWRLVNLIDVTLTCEDASSKLVEVVTVADVDNEDRVDISLLQIWSWGLDIKLNFCSDFEHKVWSRFWSWLLMFGWGYEVESWSRFLS